jgi:hypothetical protein
MAQVAGITCKLYVLATGTFGSPSTWTLLDDTANLSRSGERTKIAVKKRGSLLTRYLLGLRDTMVTFDMVRDLADADQIALETAHTANPPTDKVFALADGAIATTGTRYWKAEMVVSKFAETESLEEPAMVECELVLSATSTNDPVRVTV